MFRGSDKVVFLSRHYTEDALQLAGAPERARLYAIPNLLTYDPVQPDLSGKENAVLYVGRLADSPKKVDRLLNVWKKCSRFIRTGICTWWGTARNAAIWNGWRNG